ncbi:MAG TPA: hypothetical protein H9757_10505, partial [Candidatus Mediterraneibacter faecigallinarum]|nr:hypothetical protein [Candidatus Mediterraneibacter faecigallinarum]
MAKSNPKNNTTRFTQTVLFFGLTPPSGAFSFSSPSERSLDPPPLISEYVFDPYLCPAGFGR